MVYFTRFSNLEGVEHIDVNKDKVVCPGCFFLITLKYIISYNYHLFGVFSTSWLEAAALLEIEVSVERK